MRNSLTILIIGLATIGLLFGIVSTSTGKNAHSTEQFWMEAPFPFPITNSCVSETETLVGTLRTHFVDHLVVDKYGFEYHTVSINIAGGTVIGADTGTTYHFQQTFNQKQIRFVIPPPPAPPGPVGYPAIFHFINHVVVVGPGPMNNMKTSLNWVIVYNANGEMTVEMGAPPEIITCPDSH